MNSQSSYNRRINSSTSYPPQKKQSKGIFIIYINKGLPVPSFADLLMVKISKLVFISDLVRVPKKWVIQSPSEIIGTTAKNGAINEQPI